MRRLASRLAILASLFLLVGCDHATKLAAKAELQGAPPREIVRGILRLQYVENTDVAFNLLRGVPVSIRAPALLALGTLAVCLLAVALFRRRDLPSLRLPLMLVTAGAIGNTLDRFLRGYVIDFLRLPHWPVFNVADMYVTVGSVLLLLSTIRPRRDLGLGRGA